MNYPNPKFSRRAICAAAALAAMSASTGAMAQKKTTPTVAVTVVAVSPPNNTTSAWTQANYPYRAPADIAFKVTVRNTTSKSTVIPTGTVTVTGGGVNHTGTLVPDASCTYCASVTLPTFSALSVSDGAGSSFGVTAQYNGNNTFSVTTGWGSTPVVGPYQSATHRFGYWNVSKPGLAAVIASGVPVNAITTVEKYSSQSPHNGYVDFSFTKVADLPNPRGITTPLQYYYGSSACKYLYSGLEASTVAILSIPGVYQVRGVNGGNEFFPCLDPNAHLSGEADRCAPITLKVVDKAVQIGAVMSKSTAVAGETVMVGVTLTGLSGTGGFVVLQSGGSWDNPPTELARVPVTDTIGKISIPVTADVSKTIVAYYTGSFEGNNTPAETTVQLQVLASYEATVGTTEFFYDHRGNSVLTKDPFLNESRASYNALGQKVEQKDPSPNTVAAGTTTAFDKRGKITAVTDARDNVTAYTVNGMSQVRQTISPDTGTSNATFDAEGRVLTRTDARAKTTTYAYDALGRLTSATYPNGVATTHEYDGGATPVARNIRKLTKVTDESGQTEYDWNVRGQQVSKVQTTNSKVFTQLSEYGTSGTGLGKLVAQTLPGKSRILYAYDAQGRMSSVSMNPVNAAGTSPDTSVVIPLISAITYDAQGKLASFNWETPSAGQRAAVVSRAYDLLGSLTSYTSGYLEGKLHTRALVRDGAGRIVGYQASNEVDGRVAALDQSFQYDVSNRLIAATVGSAAYNYGYDDVHNRYIEAVGGASFSNTIATNSNRLTVDGTPTGNLSHSFDASGNTVDDGNATFTYSDRGRLASATVGGASTQYQYNAFEQRVAKLGANTAYYVYEGTAGSLVGEYDANGDPVYETVYLGDLPVAVIKYTGAAGAMATSVHYVYADHLNTPRVIVDRDDLANVRWRWDQADPYGAAEADQNPMGLGVFVFNQRFPGQVYDAETGLHHNWRRTYNPRTGRYLESDPTGLAGGINTYEYAGGAPTLRVDPTGEIPILVPVVTGAAVGTASAIATAVTGGNFQQIVLAGGAGFVAGASGNALSTAMLLGRGGMLVEQIAVQTGVRTVTGTAQSALDQGLANQDGFTPNMDNVNWTRALLEGAAGAAIGGVLNGSTTATIANTMKKEGMGPLGGAIDKLLNVPPNVKDPVSRYLKTTLANEATNQPAQQLRKWITGDTIDDLSRKYPMCFR